jgi:DtxR family Mn-dependent transcriptional regulator
MRLNLDDPQLCPHGNPLPGYEYVAAGWLPLTGVQPGEKVIIRRIHETAEDNPELMEYLEKNGVIPGTRAEVCDVLSFNQTLCLQIAEKQVALGFPIAKYIFVEKAA